MFIHLPTILPQNHADFFRLCYEDPYFPYSSPVPVIAAATGHRLAVAVAELLAPKNQLFRKPR
jgi:hypothetical protein